MKIKNNILAIAVLTLILTGCETISSGTKSDDESREEEKALKLGDINVANSNSRLAFDFEEVSGAKEYHFKLVDSLGETWMEDEKYEPKTVVNIEQLPPGSYLPYLKAVAMEKYKDSEWTSSKISFKVSSFSKRKKSGEIFKMSLVIDHFHGQISIKVLQLFLV